MDDEAEDRRRAAPHVGAPREGPERDEAQHRRPAPCRRDRASGSSPARCRACRRSAWRWRSASRSSGRSSAFPPSAMFLPYHQLQSRPYVVDRTDLHVDEMHRQRDVADHILGDVGRDFGRFLRPADPDEAGAVEQREELRRAWPRARARSVTKICAASIGRFGRGRECASVQLVRRQSRRATLCGMPSRHTRMPSLSDSFFASGVPE